VSTTGNQTYTGAMVLGADAKLTASGNAALISTQGTINSDGTARALNMTATGTNASVAINNRIGNADALQSLNVSARNITLGASSLDTLGNQSFAGVMTLSANAVLTAADRNASITTNGAINSDSASRSLTMKATGSNSQILVNGALGSTAVLNALTLNAPSILLNGGEIKTSGDQLLRGSVTLGRDLTIQASEPNSILSFEGTIDSDKNAARSLTVASGGANTQLRLANSVGSKYALASFNNSAAETQIGQALNRSQIAIKTLENMQFDGNVQLLSPTQFVLAGQGEVNGVISGSGTLIKDGLGSLRLTNANKFTGNTVVDQGRLSIANSLALGAASSNVSVAAGATLDLQGVSVVDKLLTLQGGVLLTSSGMNNWSGPVTLTSTSQFDVAGQQLNVSGQVNAGQAGLLVTGNGAVSMNHEANAISQLATASSVSSVDLKNSIPMVLGDVTVGQSSANGVQSRGAIHLLSTASVTVPEGASIASSRGDVVVETSQWINKAGATAVQVSEAKQWQVWSTNASPFAGPTRDSVNTLNNDYVQYNATRSSLPIVPNGNGLLFSYAPTVVASLQGSVVKIYDSNTNAQLSAANYKLEGEVNNDQLSLNNPAIGAYVSAGTAATLQGAGLNKDVQVSGLVLTATQLGKPVFGYRFVSTITGNVGEIIAKVLDLSFTKVYEGNNQFDNADSYTLTKMVTGEASPKISSGLMTVESPNASTYKKYSSTTLTLDNPNYTLVGGAQLATIQPAPLGIAIKTLFKAKTELPDIAAKDFSVVGLQNGEIIPKIDLLTLNFKDVSKNDENYVKAIAVTSGPGIANVANYFITQAVNSTDNPLAGGTTMNMVKLISPDEVITMPAAPPPVLPVVTVAAAPTPTPVASPVNEPASAPTVASVPVTAAAPTIAASVIATSVEPATSGLASAIGVQPIIASNVTPGVIVSTVRQSTPQANGLVTVELPKEMVNLGIIPLVIPLPTAVTNNPSVQGDATTGLSVALSNNQPLPDWIRYDANQKALVTIPDALASFPITVVITIGEQRTVVVVSEKTIP
jgi:autotransporter-associated beta strand protein